ncbi:hypothetical protein [Acrocarpospora sp. B8E8]|uniref:hypothetical protein n=1 Tax=Acrocarpospora sp. B8E8 TaxID=3153572 RepID=UPI00325CDD24
MARKRKRQPASPYYRYIKGEPVITDAGLALLVGLTVEDVKAEHDRQKELFGEDHAMFLPPGWQKLGRRVRKEVSAALGHEPSMKESIDYLAAKQQAGES